MSPSDTLTRFFEAEIANDDAMRREAGAPGTDDYEDTFDPDGEAFVPEATLASALDSWSQAPDDVRAAWTGAEPADLASIEDELRSLIASHGEQTALTDLT